MYRSLCWRWKPNIQENEVIKLILKNSNPKLARQLQSSGVNTVDGLGWLGHQLERTGITSCYTSNGFTSGQNSKNDRIFLQNPLPQQRLPLLQLLQNLQAHFAGFAREHMLLPPACLQIMEREKGTRTFLDPRLDPWSTSSQTGNPHPSSQQNLDSLSPLHLARRSPFQMIVPLTTGPWKGKAIKNTGRSFILLNQDLWMDIGRHTLTPWMSGPIYVAARGAKTPTGSE